MINYIAVLAAAVASMIIGGIWYGPLFGRMYIRAMGWANHTPAQRKEMQRDMMWKYLWQFIASILMFYVLARFMNATDELSVAGGMVVAVWAWLGFVVPMKFGDTLWGGKKIIFWLGIFNSLITFLVGAAILGYWH